MCESRNKESLNLHWGFSDRIMGNLLLPQAASDGELSQIYKICEKLRLIAGRPLPLGSSETIAV
jgi:hypothetical protein